MPTNDDVVEAIKQFSELGSAIGELKAERDALKAEVEFLRKQNAQLIEALTARNPGATHEEE